MLTLRRDGTIGQHFTKTKPSTSQIIVTGGGRLLVRRSEIRTKIFGGQDNHQKNSGANTNGKGEESSLSPKGKLMLLQYLNSVNVNGPWSQFRMEQRKQRKFLKRIWNGLRNFLR